MSLTTEEETKVKEIVAKKVKEETIESINATAYSEIQVLKDSIQAIEDKRISDIAKL